MTDPTAPAALDQLGVPAVDPERIVTHSLGGARWMLWLSASALACGFGTNVVLGRIGPELLGFYGFLTLTVSLISVFFVLGGSNVLVNYLPKQTKKEKLPFLLTYGAIVLLSAGAFLALVAAFPFLLDLIYGTVSESSVLTYLAAFLPVVALQTLVWSALQADLDLKVLAISHQLVSSLNFAVLAFVAAAGWLEGDVSTGRRYVLISMLAANTAALVLALVRLWRKQIRSWERAAAPHLPGGFWRFSLFFHSSTLVQFAVRSLDQVYVLRELGFVALGYYRSALVLAQLANFLLVVTDRAFYSTFCNVGPATHAGLHRRFVRLNTVGTALAGLVLLLFSREVLELFGESATSSSTKVLLLLAGAILLAFPITSVNNAVVAARERMNMLLVNNVIGAVTAIVLYETFAERFGLVGIAAAFAILQLLMLVVSSFTARRAASVTFSLSSFTLSAVAVAIGIGGALVFDDVTPVAVGVKLLICASFVPVAVLSRLATVDDLREFAALVLPGRWTRGKAVAT